MSDLTQSEKLKFEKLLGMKSGYVADFSDRTFDNFFTEAVGIRIYEERFGTYGTSKANHLRAFWALESNALVAKAMQEMLARWKESNSLREYTPSDNEMALFTECQKVAIRLQSTAPIDSLDAVKADPTDKSLTALAVSIRESISKNQPEAGLDRLHTYTTKFLRALCDKHGIVPNRSKPLHSLMGEYIKHINSKGFIESEMTERILKSSISILEAFNDVRNNRSLAHDNKMLNHEESLLIFNQVTGAIKFVDALEAKAAQPTSTPPDSNDWDEIPF